MLHLKVRDQAALGLDDLIALSALGTSSRRRRRSSALSLVSYLVGTVELNDVSELDLSELLTTAEEAATRLLYFESTLLQAQLKVLQS